MPKNFVLRLVPGNTDLSQVTANIVFSAFAPRLFLFAFASRPSMTIEVVERPLMAFFAIAGVDKTGLEQNFVCARVNQHTR